MSKESETNGLDIDGRVFGIAFSLILVLGLIMVCLSLNNDLFVNNNSLISFKLIITSFIFYEILIGFLKFSPKIFGGVFISEKK